jgi:hypothetical protein
MFFTSFPDAQVRIKDAPLRLALMRAPEMTN